MTSVQYKFTNLSEIRVGEIYNVIAAVKFFKTAKQTNGTSFIMPISITDPSIGYENKLTCNIFNDRPENLPRITSRGDVIIIHRLKIGSYNEKPQGTGTHRQGFAAAVFSHADGVRILNASYDQHPEILKSDCNHFNITKADFERVQAMMEWANDMPSSQQEECTEEVNIDTLQLSTLSVIRLGETVSLAVQIVSILSVDCLQYKTMLLVWDATKPSYELNKKYITSVSEATSAKHCTELMAKFGGKLSNPFLTCILFKETLQELKQSFVRPGDYVYLTKVTVSTPNNGPGVVLVGEQCQIGPLPQDYPLYDELCSRTSRFNKHTPCVADCVSKDVATLTSLHLQDLSKMLQQISQQSQELSSDCKFRITARVVNVHPSTEKEFYESLLSYCTCCHSFVNDAPLSVDDHADCSDGLVLIPMVTLIFEDFTGWLTCVVVGQAVMGLTSLVMIDATRAQWWADLVVSRDSQMVAAWLRHINRLKEGWVGGKLVFRRASHSNVVPFVDDIVILDY